MGLGKFKGVVAEAISGWLAEVRAEYERLVREPGWLLATEREGARRARDSAEETMEVVRSAVGLGSWRGVDFGFGELKE